MANQIAVQSDIGSSFSSGLQGLSHFSNVLATISADNVSPSALLQMEQLGTMFHLNGPLARQVPEVLRRCKSYRFERMALAVGWRKGDAASLLAESAGGQAAAVILLILFNTFPISSDEILYDLCEKLLPRTANISAPAQLGRVTEIVSGKMATLAYGNLLAHHATRIRQVYLGLDLECPKDLLALCSTNNMVDLLEMLSKATRSSEVTARFSGSSGMGFLMTLVLTLCPDDCLVTVEGVIIHRGTRQNIIIDVHGNGQIEATIEHPISGPNFRMPITLSRRTCDLAQLHLRWENWLGTRLDLQFLSEGFICTDAVKIACYTILLCWRDIFIKAGWQHRLLVGLLGPGNTIHSTLHQLFGVAAQPKSHEAHEQLLAHLTTSVAACINCGHECHHGFTFLGVSVLPVGPETPHSHFDANQLGLGLAKMEGSCHQTIWRILLQVLHDAFACLFLNSEASTIVPTFLAPNISQFGYSRSLFHGMFPGWDSALEFDLGRGTASSVTYVHALKDLARPNSEHGIYDVVDGQFILNGHYFDFLTDTSDSAMAVSLRIPSVIHRPSCDGSEGSDNSHRLHSSNKFSPDSVSLTAREGSGGIKLRCEVVTDSVLRAVSLKTIMHQFLSACWSIPCEHARTSPLCSLGDTSAVLMPYREKANDMLGENFVELAMARGDLQAQFIALGDGADDFCYTNKQCLLQGETCSQCVWDQACKPQAVSTIQWSADCHDFGLLDDDGGSLGEKIRFRRIITT